MDKRFLDKVLDQLVYETRIDYDRKVIKTPLLSSSYSSNFPLHSFSRFFSIDLSPFVTRPLPSFTKHCKGVYGLNGDEIEYVWEEYKRIIKDKISQ